MNLHNTARSQHPVARPIRILHVDDEPALVEMAGEFLKRENNRLQIETESTVQEGLDRLNNDIDCIISDYDMPGQNGIEFLRAVREEYSDLPFILFTGKGSEEVASEAISAGVTDYLQKENGIDQYSVLANRVVNYVEKQRTEQRAERWAQAVETAGEGIAIVGEDGRYIEVNEAYAELYGDDRSELVGESWEATVADSEVELVRTEGMTELAETGEWSGKVLGQRADGSTYHKLISLSSLDGGGHVCVVRDVTDIEEQREQLEQTNALLSTLFEMLPAGVLAEDENRTIRAINQQMFDLFDLEGKPEDVIGANCQQLADDVENLFVDSEQFTDRTDELVADRKPSEHEELTLVDGRTFERSYQPIELPDKSGHLWLYRDITEPKARERVIEDLHETARKVSKTDTKEDVAEIVVKAVADILDMPCNGIWFYNEDEDILQPVVQTKQATEVVGELPTFSAGESLAWEVFETGEPQHHDDISTVNGRFNPDTVVRSEILLPLGGHGILTIGSTEIGAFDEADLSLAQTVTTHAETALNRIENERELREERTFINQALNTLDEIFYVVAPDGRMLEWNDRLSEVTGHAEPEVANMRVMDFFPEDEQERIQKSMQEALTAGQTAIEADLLSSDGNRTPYEFTGARLTDAEGELIGMVGTGRDISERREREAKLEKTTAQLEVLYDNSPDMIDILDTEGKLVDVNQRFCKELGYTEDELLGKPIWEIDQLVDADDVLELLADFELGERRKFEGRYERKDGATFPVEVHLLQLNIVGETRFLAISRDITERKAHEQELERQNERLEEFASIVSHDLRNPLNVAQGRLELARRECDNENLTDVARAHRRMETLVDDMLTLARQGESAGDIETVDLADAVDNCWQNVDTLKATLVNQSTQSLRADSSRLQQLLENLVRNAIEHGGDNVTVTVGDLKDGFYIADDGPGIPEDERDKVFENGYSTSDEGTGFGLAIARTVADAHGWDLSVKESKDGGARFEITGTD